MSLTTRLSLPYPEETDGPSGADVPYWMKLLAVKLDGAALDDQGILANRPVSTSMSPGIKGRYYMVSGDSTAANNGILWRDNGTGWDQVGRLDHGTIVNTKANIPAASTALNGLRFYATDEHREYLCVAAAWVSLTRRRVIDSVTGSGGTTTSTTEGTATAILQGTSLAYEATDKLVEFFAPEQYVAPEDTLNFVLLRGATVIAGLWGVNHNLAGAQTEQKPVKLEFVDVAPPASTYRYTVAIYVSGGTGHVVGGAGGTGALAPCLLRVSEAT